MNRLGAAKVNTLLGPVWCHLSDGNDTRKLRRYANGTIYEIDANEGDIETFVSLEHCKKLVKAKSYKFAEADVWTAIFNQLESGLYSTETPTITQPATQIIVPITHLRRFYESLKLFDDATFKNLAEFYSRYPQSLERLWQLSHKAFDTYRNPDGWGQSSREPLPQPPKSLSLVTSTDEFTAFIKESRFGTEEQGYTFVDREINPRRTRQGVFSDNLPATKSGRGGMDLLLRSVENGFPTVGEVKVKKDKTAFYALIQAMCYAVELSTASQLQRIKSHFPAFHDLIVEEAKVGIVILLVNPRSDSTRQAVTELLQIMNKRRKCAKLGRVVMLENKGDTWATVS